MAEKRRFLDVWLTEPNTVYREVPYTVVADWVQQSRIQPDDMLRPSGTAQWFRVGDSPEFKPYIPTREAVSVEDEASAREDIVLDFRWKKRRDEGEDDVDMIPLIDVSLVLLVFFMLTSTVADAGSLIPGIPKTENGLIIGKEGIRFLQYYGEQSCTAGRSAFLTGQHIIRTGLSKVGFPGAPMGMSQLDPSIGGLLKSLGYATGQFGKNHVGDRNESLPTVNGFDVAMHPVVEAQLIETMPLLDRLGARELLVFPDAVGHDDAP